MLTRVTVTERDGSVVEFTTSSTGDVLRFVELHIVTARSVAIQPVEDRRRVARLTRCANCGEPRQGSLCLFCFDRCVA